MSKKVSAVAIHALKEALCSIYWYRNDLKAFLWHTITDKSVLNSVNLDNYKRQMASDVVDVLFSNEEKYNKDIQNLIAEVVKMKSFGHLEKLEDGKRKAAVAKTAVEELRKFVESHEQVAEEGKQLRERQAKEAEKLQRSKAIIDKLEEIKSKYMDLVTSTAYQKRGFELERILYDLFGLFDLDPKASFRNTGEQIDGAFVVEGTDYLFSAKWEKELISIEDLDAFSGKVRRKLDNTLGLFLSISGFSEDGVKAHSTGRPVVILMTGADLMAVLEGRIEFSSLILRKKRHASLTGEILWKYNENV